MGCCKCEQYKWPHPLDATITDRDGHRYCLLHAPAPLKTNRDKEIQTLIRNIILNKTSNKRPTSPSQNTPVKLTGIIIPCHIDLSGLNIPEIDFSNSKFLGYFKIKNATFLGTARFINCKFFKNANFVKATFSNKTYFESTSFYSLVSFDKAIFIERASFEDIHFFKTTKFNYSTFNTYSSFSKIKFHSTSEFNNSTFERGISFSNITFESDAHFIFSTIGLDTDSYSIFNNIKSDTNTAIAISKSHIYSSIKFVSLKTEGKMSFDNTVFHSRSSFVESDMGNASFRHCHFLTPPTFEKVDFRRTELLGAPVENFRIMACTWPLSNGRSITYDARKANGHGFFDIENVRAASEFPKKQSELQAPKAKHLEDLYRRLKKAAREEMDEPLASDFHYAEKEMQRFRSKNQFHNRIESRHWPERPLSATEEFRGGALWIALSIYKLISGYGEDPKRALIILLLFILSPYFVLHILHTWYPELFADLALSSDVLLTQWLSFIPLAKIPEQNTTSPLARWMMLFFQVTITLQAALFGFALRNRFRR